jgi:enamine deaminase RidA (YjgF/YER057c/UK114 family)
MGNVEEKLAQLGLALPSLQVFPNANRTAWVRVGDLLFLSGHPPAPGDGVRTEGKVGADMTEEEGYTAARACALNVLATVRAATGNLDRVRRVVKLTAFVNSAPGFTRQFAVVDGASDLFLRHFGPEAVSTRTSVGVLELARGIPVEIDATFHVEP